MKKRYTLNYQTKTKGSVEVIANHIANFDTDYQAVLLKALEIDAILPTIADQRKQNDIVLALKTQNLWAMHDGIFLFTGSGGPLFKKINWKDRTLAEEDGYGDLIFDSTGIQGDEVNFLKSNVVYSNYTLNDASVSFDLVSIGSSNPLISAKSNPGTNNTGDVNVRILAATTFQNFNGSNSAIMDFSSSGFYSISRSTNNSVISSINGVIDETETFSSTIMPEESIKLFVNGSILGNSKLGSLLIGSNVDGRQDDVYNAIKNAPTATVTGGVYSVGYTPLMFSGNYGTYNSATKTFTLNGDNMGLTSGIVTDLKAKENRKIINEAIRYVFEETEADTLKFGDDIDVFINTNHGKASREASYANSIQIGFDNVVVDFGESKFRVQPNKYFQYCLVGIWQVTNTTIKNGFFYGDRYTHNYDPESSLSHDNGMGIVLYGGKNVNIENIFTTEFTGDGLGIRSSQKRNEDGSESTGGFFTDNVLVKNSTFTYQRRNGASVTDGDNVTFDTCVFSYNGLSPIDGSSNFGLDSDGYTPKAGIDWEAIQTLHSDGVTLLYDERIRWGKMINCDFIGNYTDVVPYKVFGLELAYNNFSSGVLNRASTDVFIHHNNFDYNTTESEGIAVLISSIIRSDNSNFTTGWRVEDNTFNNYPITAQIGGNGTTFLRNTITNYSDYGLYLRERGENLNIDDNSFTTSATGTTALYNFPAGVTLDNVIISNNIFVGQYGFNLINISGLANDSLNITNCDFTGTNKIQNVTHTTVQNSNFETPVTESGTNNVIYNNNN